MSALNIAELCEALPPEKREEVADIARFLLARISSGSSILAPNQQSQTRTARTL